ncbi:poly(A) polymerase Cid1 [Schizosaccharomyces octosporus yFS286]|uniref:Poly(A) polymerase Cid1 n=1 Tax=Schizosaccharomyces octosporus (strain yFS286) TaxID=483514 RepID=S9RGW9_SCHOY|nr:poly(A) polymerase Cid1 [Schizosaccharomyces octosporus yFS286]EPX73304.1 poly(A) polymerase Cid1 [Schizosaccharomyces octosporus yFS286]
MSIPPVRFVPGVHTVEEIESQLANLHVAKKSYVSKSYSSYKELTKFFWEVYHEIKITDEEIAHKREAMRVLSEYLHRICSDAVLASFGSLESGFALKHSDMDLCVLTESLEASEPLAPLFYEELVKEGFEGKFLQKARIPIIKLIGDEKERFGSGFQCDIGFNNRLAIHNTKLLSSYSRLDSRFRPLMLLVKYWAKQKRINSPYFGTLSSYGYALMLLYYLLHVVKPPVFPNLQQARTKREKIVEGFDVGFEENIERFPPSSNVSTLGSLLHGFFRYYAYKFEPRDRVITFNRQDGVLTKQEKGWTSATEHTGSADQIIKDRYILAIEDPFETTHNVGRTVSSSGLYRIRGEFMSAARLINSRVSGSYKELFEQAPLPPRRSKKVADETDVPEKEDENNENPRKGEIRQA